MNHLGFDSQQEKEFAYLQNVHTSSEADPDSYSVGNGALASWVKRPGCQTSIPPIFLHDMCRDDFSVGAEIPNLWPEKVNSDRSEWVSL